MTEYVFPQPPPPTLSVVGSTLRFPVRRVFCVGRNYVAHAREMGGDDREPPFFFDKPPDALVEAGSETAPILFPYPPCSDDVQYEVELVVALAAGGRDIKVDAACSLVFGYAVGLDMTRRDLQRAAKTRGHPWTMAKAFDCSAPCSAIVPADAVDAAVPDQGRIWLTLNGEVQQEGDLSQMIWSVAEVIAELSRMVTLHPGDLIFTGTPSGVGPVVPGDEIAAGVEGVTRIQANVGGRSGMNPGG